MNINGKSNAVFINKADDLAAVLDAFAAPASSGELDTAVLLVMKATTAS